MNRRGLKRYWLKIRRFMLNLQSKDFLVFVFCLLISTGFWMLQTLNEAFDLQISVPLQLHNVPSDVVITTPLPDQVHLSVHDRGTSLWNYFRRSNFDTIRVDFSLYDTNQQSGRVMVSLGEVQRRVLEQLDPTASIVRVNPDTLEFFYTRNRPRRLPVAFRGTVSTTPQTYLLDTRFEPDSVTVWAPKSVLDTMRCIPILPVNHQGISQTQSYDARLLQRRGVRVSPSSVRYQLVVDTYNEKTVEVPVIASNFPGELDLRTFPSRVKITFRVGATRYEQISAESFVLRITYEELLQNRSSKFHLHLTNIPEGVSNVRITPSEVDYLIEQVEQSEEEEVQP